MKFSLPMPVPSAGVEAYELERKLALGRSHQTMDNYIRYRQTKRTADLDYLPVKLDIENVSRCNFRCIMCQVNDFPSGGRAADMPLDDFRNLIDEQFGLIEIKLQGMGEPTLARDTLYEMITYARSRHIWVRTITNASLLHVNDNYMKMIDSGANEVQISIDGATKASYESIRRGAEFDRTIENCRMINSYAASRNVHTTKMWVVVQQANIGELSKLVELAHDAGFSSLVFSLELHDWGQDKWRATMEGMSAMENFNERSASKLVELGRELGVSVAFWFVSGKYRTGAPETLCPWPFERAYVSSDMRVVPCCMMGNPEVMDLGEAKELTRTWHAPAYVNFRRAHLDGNIPAPCRGCYENQD